MRKSTEFVAAEVFRVGWVAFFPNVKSKGLVKTCHSYEKLINFQYKGRQREISIFRRLILEVMVDLTFIEHFYLLGEGSFF